MKLRRHYAVVLCILLSGWSIAADKPATNPTEVRTYSTWQELLKEVPIELRPADASKLTDLQIEVINGILAEKVKNQRARLRTAIRGAEIQKGGNYDGMPRLIGEYEKAGRVRVATVFYFSNTEESKRIIVSVQKGDIVHGSGDISSAGFDREGGGVRFMVRIVNTTLSDSSNKDRRGVK